MDTRKVRSAMVWLLLSAAVIAIDQGSKAWVLTHLPEYTPVPVIDGLWNWYRSYNTGAAFSFLSEAGGWQQVLFSVLAVIVSVALGRALSKTRLPDWRRAAPYALIIGGALSNALDRMMRGHVVDFIQWYWRSYYWPSFNLSDVAIMLGAFGLVAFELRSARTPASRRR
ncbi:MAG: signal peptidase II [Pseudomonadota bacterium]